MRIFQCTFFISLLCLSFVSAEQSFKSGIYAHRAKIQWKDGNYSAAASLYNNALNEALREANLPSENKIRLNRAHLELDAMRVKETKRWISSLSPNHKSLDVYFHKLLLELQMAIQTGDCKEKVSELSGFMKKHKANESLNLKVARIPMSICFAQSGQFKKASNQIKWTEEEFEGKAQGQRAYAQAWIELHLHNWTRAIKNLHTAFDFAQKAMRPYELGQILFHLGNCYEKLDEKDLAKQFYYRSFTVFNKIQILNPMARSLNKYLEYEADDQLENDLKIISSNLSEAEKNMIHIKPTYFK